MPLPGSVYELKTLISKQSVYAECPLNGKQCVDTEIGLEGRALRTQIKEWAVHVKECTVIAVALSVLSRLQSDRSLAGSASWVSALYLYRMHWHCPAGSASPVWDLHAAVLRQVDKLPESLQSTGLIQGIEEFGHHDRAEFEPNIYEVLQTRFTWISKTGNGCRGTFNLTCCCHAWIFPLAQLVQETYVSQGNLAAQWVTKLVKY